MIRIRLDDTICHDQLFSHDLPAVFFASCLSSFSAFFREKRHKQIGRLGKAGNQTTWSVISNMNIHSMNKKPQPQAVNSSDLFS